MLSGAGIQVLSSGPGNGGGIFISADSILLDPGGTEFASTIGAGATGEGDGGSIHLVAENILLLRGAVVDAHSEGSGLAGDIVIEAGTLFASFGSVISTESLVSDGGSILIRAGSIALDADESGRSSTVSASTFGEGDGGSILLAADSIHLLDGTAIVARSEGTGFAGGITIEAGTLFESFDSVVSTESLFSDGGNITLTVGEMIYLEDSAITTSVGSGEGTGGNISIDPVFVILIDSDITANAFGGPGGNITIVAENFFADEFSVVQASSQLGVSGTVAIRTPDTDVSGSLVVLPENYLDATALLSQRCGAESGAGRSSLVKGGVRDLPPEPAGYLVASAPAAAVGAAIAGQPVACR
jgi:large exoprotein involved in heme utilization and adhesion